MADVMVNGTVPGTAEDATAVETPVAEAEKQGMSENAAESAAVETAGQVAETAVTEPAAETAAAEETSAEPASAEPVVAPVAETAAEEPTAESVAEPAEPVETMADYEAELEASFKRVREGDILTGTVTSVTDTQVFVDLKYYAQGIIDKENLSNDPNFNMKEEIHPGEELTATVVKTDDGEGNIVLSRKDANELLAWEKLEKMMAERTIVPVRITEVVKSGVVTQLEGIRGFIPASKLAAGYVEDLEEWNGKTLEVTVITVDPEKKKLVLSGKEVAREKEREEKKKRIAKCEVGAVMQGTVDSIKPYGAFIELENGLSGLVHISQISRQRIKNPAAVLKEGQTVTVKIISIADNKISLSMKAVESDEEPQGEVFNYHESGEATTGLGALLKGLKF